ncbi:MAG: PilW family protein [Wenzhouxiangella sp.]
MKQPTLTIIRKAAGFTLVELMVALALSLFLLGGLLLTFASGRSAAADAEGLSRIQENMRFASDSLLRDIRNAGFRDQLTLTFEEYELIGQSYAEITDGEALTIRYAGRSHCGQSRQGFDQFSELRVIENRYFVDVEGNLACEGRSGSTGNTPFFSPGRETALAAGVNNLSFEFIPADATAPCTFATEDDLAAACTGVRITMAFDGLGNGDSRTAVLSASFRNIIVDRVFGR